MFDRAIADDSRRRNGPRPQATRWAWAAVIETLEQRRLLSATLTTLASFTSDSGGNDGPFAGLVLSGGTLYGTTLAQGADDDGTVFSVPVGGGTPTTLATFDGDNGAEPFASLILSGGTLYGTTYYGGADNDGTVFSLPVGGGTPAALATFDGDNGANPVGSLVLSGSTLYGAACAGGTEGDGTVFSVPVGGGAPTTLATFDDANGTDPVGVTLSGGTLYGATFQGGSNEDGTVFSVPVGGGAPATLATFDGDNGESPSTGLTLSDGTLYGTTEAGGADGDGSVFSVPVGGGAPTTLATFDGANGDNPGGLLLSGSNLYGTTESGGTYNAGLVFSVPASGGTPATLASFDAVGTDPRVPSIVTNLVSDAAGNLYGTTVYGGVGGVGGTVFALAVPVQTAAAVTSSDASPADGQPVTFTATVTPASGSGETGTVQFQIDGSNVGSPVSLSGDTAAYTTSTLAAGSHSIVAVYSGDSNFATSTSPTFTQNVVSLPAGITAASGAAYTYNADANTLSLTSGTLTFNGVGSPSSLTLNVTADGSGSNLIFNTTTYLNSLTLTDGATAQLVQSGTGTGTSAVLVSYGTTLSQANTKVLELNSLNIPVQGATLAGGGTNSAQGTLDLTNNAMILNYAPGSSAAGLAVADALAGDGSDGGVWDGTGIISSNAEADNNSNGYTAVGVADNGDLGYNTFAGQNVSSGTQVLFMYTYNGDADLNGMLNVTDTISYESGLATHPGGHAGTGWEYGSLDYGATPQGSISDLQLLEAGFRGYKTNGAINISES